MIKEIVENGQGVKINWKSWKLRVGLTVVGFLLLAVYLFLFGECEVCNCAKVPPPHLVSGHCYYLGFIKDEWYYDGQEDIIIFGHKFTWHEPRKAP